MGALQAEIEASSQKTLTVEEKLHARNADVAQWSKAKTRAHFTLPKVRDFIHRATWALGAPERKELGELFKDHAQPDLTSTQVEALARQLEILLKQRQILSALGGTVHQEGKSVSADIQGTLKTLQINAAMNADRQRRAAGAKGKFFKDIRRLSGAD
jgi:hypothetical protein